MLTPLLTALRLNGAALYLTPHSSANEYIKVVARCRFPPVPKTRATRGRCFVRPSEGQYAPAPFPIERASAMLTPSFVAGLDALSGSH